MNKLSNLVRKNSEDKPRRDSEEERFIPPKITWLHSWSLNETRGAISQSFFSDLPNEVILYIFRFLSVRDLGHVSLVCRAFKIIADDDQIWKRKLYSEDNLQSKSYKHMYMKWIHEKSIRNRKLRVLERQFMTRTACVVCLPPVRRIHPVIKSKFNAGFNQHPNSSEDLVVNFSVDLDRTAPELISLLKKASSFQQPAIFKQMIQRYYRFLQLKSSTPSNILLIPTLDIEIIWQTHLLRPEMYRNDCLRLFRRIIDHSLIIDDINSAFKEDAFLDTCRLYEERFGEVYCPLPSIEKKTQQPSQSLYSYWDQTYFQYSDQSPSDYENPFSFTEADFILDGKWLSLCEQFLSNTQKKKRSIYNRLFNRTTTTTTNIHLDENTLKRLKKSYERFLFMAAKYPLKDGHGFIPPTYAIDILWHSHMQEPVNYANDCLRLVGYIVYHNPWPMIEDQPMKDAHNQVNRIWQEEFHNSIDTDHL